MDDELNLGDLSLACAWALVDGLVRGGVRDACLSPGSRSTPIALALARHPSIQLHVHLDERSSGFFAVGLANASRRPVIIACTSGTAAAEFLPAIVEASRSRVPLLALTADRPPRLRGTGANQTIDQVGLYGGYVRECLDLPVPETPGQEAWWAQSALQALEATRSDPVGPVHLNCPFDEPLTPSPGATLPPPNDDPLELPRRAEAALTDEEADRLAGMVSGARGAVVIGGWPGDLTGEASYWSQSLGWPVIAEPTGGGARRPEESLAAGQTVLGDMAWVGRHRPDLVIQVGATPTSRATQAFIAGAERLIVADRWHPDSDPDRQASWRLAVDADVLREALERQRLRPADDDWTRAWADADRAARSALDRFLDGVDEPFEPRIARDIAAWIPERGTLFVGNSTPIRDLDLAMAPRDGLRVMANRGASGIDGLVSTALGIASAGPRSGPADTTPGPTVALLGDLSVQYDIGALLWAGRAGVDLVVVVVANGGGEIFSLLPQRQLPEHRELFVTPHQVDLASVCAAADVGYAQLDQAAALTPALDDAVRAGGLQVVEVVVDPVRALELRTELQASIDAALAGSAP
ncbi:MAG TPA: 2-succinyl-5-enolpyruvyl-6-hydroxy-3-cyclohexene-1-carboxylic-acid synthase [Actinomycetota bacterium]